MAEDGVGECLDIGGRDVGATIKEDAGFCADDKALRGAETCAPVDPLVDEVRGAGSVRAGGAGEADSIPGGSFCDGCFPNNFLECEKIFSGEERLYRFVAFGGGFRYDRDFVVLAEVVDADVKHETVKLCLWQRIGAFHFYGVFRG